MNRLPIERYRYPRLLEPLQGYMIWEKYSILFGVVFPVFFTSTLCGNHHIHFSATVWWVGVVVRTIYVKRTSEMWPYIAIKYENNATVLWHILPGVCGT